ncbi:MAG: MerR family transcriptional regulator [Proteobacteria bacterium]|jgi:MerR family transcriptional regulator/heat shock protein HspR|nr:MerR family transcriptional regulator [Desulfobacterales bacterium]MBL7101690.1 MerR family transcriptional regulator [Desulfobacteraceae bacterium]MBU0733584.1 MerR family transcriptional regulator [Pseudomonadota bacterium]MBL7172352.1 MerR family transcriptional regulator [Desulfobacteraceae bacterium]MBU0989967.1 MerR family transcriptional regulator [Pseudomonadota bacterium]
MAKELWTVTEVLESFQVEEGFLRNLEEEEIVCPVCREGSSTGLFHANELEKLRVAKILMEDMGVNLSGVEVILQMRQNMIEMRRQFDAILEDLAREIQENLMGDV